MWSGTAPDFFDLAASLQAGENDRNFWRAHRSAFPFEHRRNVMERVVLRHALDRPPDLPAVAPMHIIWESFQLGVNVALYRRLWRQCGQRRRIGEFFYFDRRPGGKQRGYEAAQLRGIWAVAAGGVSFDNIKGGEEAFAFHDLLAESGAVGGNFINGDSHALQGKAGAMPVAALL